MNSIKSVVMGTAAGYGLASREWFSVGVVSGSAVVSL